MKKITVVLLSGLLAIAAQAQTTMSDKFVTAMEPKIATLDTTHDINVLKDLAAAFERIGDAEKTQWLPYYYAALSEVNAGNMLMRDNTGGNGFSNISDKTDPYADKATDLLNKAEALSKDNSEIFIVRKMIATLYMMGDPMSRFMTYSPQGAQALETAMKLNPNNPRGFLLQGMDKFYTPEQFGGSKEEAKQLFDEALKRYDNFKPETSLHPHWGRGQVTFMLSQIK